MPETEGQPIEEAPVLIAPATPAFDPEAFKADFDKQMSTRISGLQSTYDRKLAEANAMIEELKTATLSEDEREQLLDNEGAEYVEQLERQVWLAESQAQYPTAYQHLQKLFETGGDVAAFADYLESALAAPAAEPEPAETVSEVDPNNAAPAPLGVDTLTTPDGQVLTKEMREQILKSFGNRSMADSRRG